MQAPKPLPDFYAILMVSHDATQEQIKFTYRRLALLFHPDKNIGSSDATAQTQLVSILANLLWIMKHVTDRDIGSILLGKF